MADNVNVTPGNDPPVANTAIYATDEVSTVHYQRIKLTTAAQEHWLWLRT